MILGVRKKGRRETQWPEPNFWHFLILGRELAHIDAEYVHQFKLGKTNGHARNVEALYCDQHGLNPNASCWNPAVIDCVQKV